MDTRRLEGICRELLEVIGEDPTREGLRETPARWARWWREFIAYEPGNTDTAFEAVRADQMVVVSGLRVWSLCEHHLLPFWCDVSVGYIAANRVLGLSKFARVAHRFAHKLQVQERLVEEVSREVESLIQTPDVAVIASGEHLCMTMRGIKTPGVMHSSIMGGVFRKDAQVRGEFLAICKAQKG